MHTLALSGNALRVRRPSRAWGGGWGMGGWSGGGVEDLQEMHTLALYGNALRVRGVWCGVVCAALCWPRGAGREGESSSSLSYGLDVGWKRLQRLNSLMHRLEQPSA